MTLPGLEANYDPVALEEAVLSLWENERTYDQVREARRDGEPFVFWEGPPTANGRPGIHHVLGRTLKDVVCRWETMCGRSVRRKAGWDTHGLPVEIEVEKELGIGSKEGIEDFGIAQFNARCRESVWRYREEWERLSARIGYWLDYENPYVTCEPDYVESVWAILKAFHDDGLLVRGSKVLPWCPRCGTGLSSHELAQGYADVESTAVTVRLPLEDGSGDLLVWTTTPWTLPSNFAVAVHPEHTYVLVETDGGRPVWLLESRAESVLGEGAGEVLETASGSDLAGRAYRPMFGGTIPERSTPTTWEAEEALRWKVWTAQWVTDAEGTGCVHCAPYGADDVDLAREHGLPLREAVDAEGRFSGFSPVADGTPIGDADGLVEALLREDGRLFAQGRVTHSYPHCWRCDSALFYRPTPGWSIRTTAFRDAMIEANDAVEWFPADIGEGRFGRWLEHNVDWALSRDRYWGTPLPLWVCGACEAEVCIGSVADLEERAGALPADCDLHRPSIDEVLFDCPECREPGMRRVAQVVDAWFDSGAMPYAQDHWPFEGDAAPAWPADFIAEGLDQTRGWFYTLHAIGTFLAGREGSAFPAGPVFRSVLVNGLVLDADGRKMSKRLGNTVDPWAVIEKHGADAVRWSLLGGGAPWLQRRFDPAAIGESRRRFFGTLASSASFLALYEGLEDDRWKTATDLKPTPLDRWLLSRAEALGDEMRLRVAERNFAGACRALESFTVDELSNWYIRRNRRRFWRGQDDADRWAAFRTLDQVLSEAAVWLAPLCPLFAESLWRRDGRSGSVHLEHLPVPDPARRDLDLEASVAASMAVVSAGRALRERCEVRTRQPLRRLHVLSADASLRARLEVPATAAEIREELNVHDLVVRQPSDGDVTRDAKPDYGRLGPKVGSAMGALAEAIGALSDAQLEALETGASLEVEAAGQVYALAAEDVRIRLDAPEGMAVASADGMVLLLETELDDDLVQEGLARELVSRIQGLRRDLGLAVEDRIRIRMDALEGGPVRVAVDAWTDRILDEVLGLELLWTPREGDGWQDLDLPDGHPCAVLLERVENGAERVV